MNNEPSSMSLCDKPKSAKEKAINYFKDNRDLFCANVKDNNVVSKAIKIAISEATHDCEEKINLLSAELNLMRTYKEELEMSQKENTDLREKIKELKVKWDYFVT